jgi:tRNA A-37 threonylcarbamoyl transferase component Bud32
MTFRKYVSPHEVDNEEELQTISASYGFSPQIIRSKFDEERGVCFIEMEDLEEMCLADRYGDDPANIPKWIWDEIRRMLLILLNAEGIEYRDITPYNFIQKDEKIYIIDFGDAKYTDGEIDWFLQEFIDGENSWNPDYK